MSSNVSQSYPSGSETEAERAAAMEQAFAAFEGLRDKVLAQTTSLGDVEAADHGAPARWWVWVCPTGDFAGRLHVAGYALDTHGLFVVCDTHGETFLR